MKIIVTSDLTIFEELRTLGEKKGFVVEKHHALNIKTKADINKDELEYVKTANNMIFQSKNAVKYSEKLHKEIQKNKEARMYCLGKYTKTELKKYFVNEVMHPVTKYSSENLLELIIKQYILPLALLYHPIYCVCTTSNAYVYIYIYTTFVNNDIYIMCFCFCLFSV